MTLRERMGFDVGDQLSITEALNWAQSNNVRHLDVNLQRYLPDAFSRSEADEIKDQCNTHDIQLGIHTSSSVNMAENSPFVSEATDEYLFSHIDTARQLGAQYVIVHGGYHFSSNVEDRIQASISRLSRIVRYANEMGVSLLLENHNPEPDTAEVHYFPTTLEECDQYLTELSDDTIEWAFNPAHAHLSEAGIPRFLTSLGIDQIGEVRLNDNRGQMEEHLPPGDGTIDFKELFDLLEPDYDGHYVLSYGTPDEMLEGREYLISKVA